MTTTSSNVHQLLQHKHIMCYGEAYIAVTKRYSGALWVGQWPDEDMASGQMWVYKLYCAQQNLA